MRLSQEIAVIKNNTHIKEDRYASMSTGRFFIISNFIYFSLLKQINVGWRKNNIIDNKYALMFS